MYRVFLGVAMPVLALAMVLLPPPRRPPQADCALALLQTHLRQDGGVTSHLQVTALDDWVDDDFLRSLTAAANGPVNVVSALRPAELFQSNSYDFVKTFVLVAAQAMIPIPSVQAWYPARTVIWLTVPHPLTSFPDRLLPRLEGPDGRSVWPGKTRVVLTSAVTGDTRIYAGRPWRGRRGGGPLVGGRGSVRGLPRRPVPSAVRLLAAARRRGRSLGGCRMDFGASPYPLVPLGRSGQPLIALFPWGSSYFLVVVPAGMGRGRSPLHRLTDAFSTSMWLATAAATAATAFLFWVGRRRVGSAVLHVLAPLLAQSPPGEAARPRSIMGIWLLATVVLAAAYQGQVLSVLTVPDPAAQINSLEELNASGLPVYTRYDTMLPANTLGEALGGKLHCSFDLDLASTVRSIAGHRNAAAIIDHQRMPALPPDTAAKLHQFRVPHARLMRSLMQTSKGSPLEMPIRKMLGRLRAGGVLMAAPRFEKRSNAAEDGARKKIISLV
ncbi:hypothetical protein ONE63_001043 [Megalurothrips usitatus]|uniref:Uncharacterized protein n=1 Tax=Megalurothrips usitatus TaxID=439358 RepID=A0AAV7XEW7_9NEOP|nr:hypothetical protein ONE63_001043 [Megalurothrips usitatus]